jgi:hypothetical protein
MSAASRLRHSPLAAVLALAACASAPTGPTVPVLPGTGKSLEQFRVDDGACQQFAMSQVMGGTAPGAAGTLSTYAMQRRYDLGYIQCMYSKGHRVPVLGPMAVRPVQAPGQLTPSPGLAPPVPPDAPR